MINKIKVHDIINLIHDYVDIANAKAVVVNYKDKELFDKIRELEHTTEIKEIKCNDDIDLYTKDIFKSEEDKRIFILFDISNISFSYLLAFAKALYHSDVKYVVLTKTSKLDTKNTKAFLIFYESYRMVGNVLLLRRLK